MGVVSTRPAGEQVQPGAQIFTLDDAGVKLEQHGTSSNSMGQARTAWDIA